MEPATTSVSSPPAAPLCAARWLGTVPYGVGLEVMDDLVRRRTAGEIPDQLLLLEHPHVVTLGRAGKSEHVLQDGAHLESLGVELFATGRGGDVTYHGPGQLVAYPILELEPGRRDLHRYVRDLERVMLAVLADHGVHGHVVPGRSGVWVERPGLAAAKVGAVGVRVARWVTSHGIALNVTTDLRYFGLIVPCGIAASAVTSLAALAPGDGVSVGAVATRFAAHFGAVFGRNMQGTVEA